MSVSADYLEYLREPLARVRAALDSAPWARR